jgi:hypothetical protein
MLAFAAIAGSMMLFALPIRAQASSRASSAASGSLRETVHEALAHRGYVFMTLAFFACGFQLVFITAYCRPTSRCAAWPPAWAPPRSP